MLYRFLFFFFLSFFSGSLLAQEKSMKGFDLNPLKLGAAGSSNEWWLQTEKTIESEWLQIPLDQWFDLFAVLKSQGISGGKLEQILLKNINLPDREVKAQFLFVEWLLYSEQWNKAWIQLRALDARQKLGGDRLQDLAIYLVQLSEHALANQVLEYLLKTYPQHRSLSFWQQLLLDSKEKQLKKQAQVGPQEWLALIDLHEQYRTKQSQVSAQVESMWKQAQLYLYQLHQESPAIALLEKALNAFSLENNVQAKLRLELGNAYAFQGKKYEALIQFAQVERLVNDSPLAYEAKLKTAKWYFYTGDFELAKEVLNILKDGTQRQIANDALNLLWVIEDHEAKDSIETNLKAFANIQALAEQQRWEAYDAALSRFDALPKDDPLQDDLAWAKALRLEQKGALTEAAQAYWKLYEQFPKDVYADDAFYKYLTLSGSKDAEKWAQFLQSFPTSYYQSLRSQ